MDKNKLAKLISTGTIDAITIPSTAAKSEKDRLVREFVKKVERVGDGELILILTRR